jgi:hypothetical protein
VFFSVLSYVIGFLHPGRIEVAVVALVFVIEKSTEFEDRDGHRNAMRDTGGILLHATIDPESFQD